MSLPDNSVLARADELADRPHLLIRWAAAVGARADATLVVLPGAWAPERVCDEIPPLLTAAEIATDEPGSPPAILLTGPLTPADYSFLAGSASAIYGDAEFTGGCEQLPRLAVDDLDAFLGRQAGGAERVVARSFDVFDTLIARRCIEPPLVFPLVGARAGMPEFAAARVEAEARILHRKRSLEDIYEQLGLLLGLDADACARLMQLELEVEREQVIPIQENLCRVRHGDLLVSDMYLSTPQIRSLLRQADFATENALIVSNDGKSTGRIWPKLVERFIIEEHLGDNAVSDVERPRAVGIPARFTDAHVPNPVENFLIEAGLRPVAELAREVRLRTWSDEPELRMAQMMQASFNVPMLVIASVLLMRFLRSRGARRVLFSSRDCYAWVPLFDQVAEQLGVDCTTEYFYTSRVTRVEASRDYLEYARSRITPEAAVVDICGSGWSLARLAELLGETSMSVFLVNQIPPTQVYRDVGEVPAGCHFGSVIGPDPHLSDTTVWEMCNYAGHGMITDVQMFDGDPVPVMAPDLRDPREMRIVATQLETAALAARVAVSNDLSPLTQALDQTLRDAFRMLYGLACQQAAYRSLFMRNFMVESDQVEAQISRTLAPAPLSGADARGLSLSAA